jgi:hypothetical protein
MSDTEIRLGNALQQLAATAPTFTGLDDRRRRVVRRRRARRGAGGAVALLVVAVAGVAIVRDDGRGRVIIRPTTGTSATSTAATSTTAGPSSTIAPEVVAPRVWTEMAPAPLRGRIEPLAVWTGSEVLIVGGQRDDVAGPGDVADAASSDGRQLKWTPFTDGAAYDPGSDTWRPLPDAPARLIGGPAIWTGDSLIVRARVGEGDNLTSAVLIYHRARDRWTTFPAGDRNTGLFDTLDVTMTWTGLEVVFWGHPGRRYDEPAVAVALNPLSGRWRDLPAGPLPGGMSPAAEWDGREVVVMAGIPADARSPRAAAAFDPATNRWRDLPSVTTLVDVYARLLPVGTDLVPAAPSLMLRDVGDVSSYANGKWTKRGVWPVASRKGQAVGAVGSSIVMAGGFASTSPANESRRVDAFDVNLGEARRLPDLPAPRQRAVVVGAGDDLFVWGGADQDDEIGNAVASGFRLRMEAWRPKLSSFGSARFCGVSTDPRADRCFFDALLTGDVVTFVHQFAGGGHDVIRSRPDGHFDVYLSLAGAHLCEGVIANEFLNASPGPTYDPFFFKIHGCSTADPNRLEPMDGRPPAPDWFRDRTPLEPCGTALWQPSGSFIGRRFSAGAAACVNTGRPSEAGFAVEGGARWQRRQEDGTIEAIEFTASSGVWARYRCDRPLIDGEGSPSSASLTELGCREV